MNAAALTVCKAFLQKTPQEKRARLFHFLSVDDQNEMQELADAFLGDPTRGFVENEKLLDTIHYSWLAPEFRAFAENEAKLFLSALSSEQVKGIKKQLLLSNTLPAINPIALPFLQRTLWKKISSEDLLPLECLPDSPLNRLLELRSSELLHLIDFLGLHDLAAQVKQIIDTARLKQVYAALSSSELAFIKTLLHQKEPLSFKRMELQKWDGKKESLRALLHQRGINRLAKALYQKEKSLLWYTSHKLDIERGELLQKLATPLEHLRAHELLVSQVEEILPLILTQNETG